MAGPVMKVFAVEKATKKAVKGEYNFRTKQTTLGGKFDLEVYTHWPRVSKDTGEVIPGQYDVRDTPGHPYFSNPGGYWLNATAWPPQKRSAVQAPDDAEQPPALKF